MVALYPKFKKTLGRTLIYLILAAGAFVILIPFAWTISTALKTPQQALRVPPEWIPSPVVWKNFLDAWSAKPFATFYANSLLVAALSIVGQVLSCSLVAYGFARLRFPGRDVLFLIVLSTLMIPFQILIIPRFILFKNLGWLDSLLPLIVPNFFGGAFNIFLLRQYFLSIPLELDDAARMDGCGHWGIFWRIILPLSKPALGAVMVFEFLQSWDDFLGPLIYLSKEANYTVALGLAAFRNDYFIEWNLFMAAAAVAMAVPLVIFFIAQKYFIEGVQLTGTGGVKG
ncbi:MAG: carbohydrate ABC transporter permease [Chloroflexi bacterium]|nr:carbohydrate ABC transporter permease [Chloroflexota bacterium]